MYQWMDNCNVDVTIYAPMKGKAKFRTSTRLKTLYSNGIIELEALEGLLPTYANK